MAVLRKIFSARFFTLSLVCKQVGLQVEAVLDGILADLGSMNMFSIAVSADTGVPGTIVGATAHNCPTDPLKGPLRAEGLITAITTLIWFVKWNSGKPDMRST